MLVMSFELILLLMQSSVISYFVYKTSGINDDLSLLLFPLNCIYMTIYTVPIAYVNVYFFVTLCCVICVIASFYHISIYSELYWMVFTNVLQQQQEEEEEEENDDDDEKFVESFLIHSDDVQFLMKINLFVQTLLIFFKICETDVQQLIYLMILGFMKIPLIYEKEKDFENYENLPPHVRIMVIDEMEPKTRCTFSGCSTLSNKEAKQSNNYIYELELSTFKSYAEIEVTHLSIGFRAEGYVLNFEKDSNDKYVKCNKMKKSKNMYNANKQLWETKLDGSRNVGKYAIQYFKRLLGMYQNRIKKLSINMTSVRPNKVDFKIKNLRNLEELNIHDGTDVRKLLPKIRKTLKVLHVEKKAAKLGNFEQIYLIEHKFYSPTTHLNKEQFLRLSASEVRIHIGSLTEDDIYNFIRSWQNGTIGKKVVKYEWVLTNSIFDVETVFRLLKGHLTGAASQQYEIEHFKEAGTRAMIHFHEDFPLFTSGSQWVLSFEPIIKTQE